MGSTPTTALQIHARYGLSLFAFASLPVAEHALYRAAYAADVLHVEEIPRGSNRGPDVERYQKSAGAEAGDPWCAAFWTCMLLDSGVSRSALPELAASVHGWLDWAKAKGIVSDTPKRGFVGLIIESATTGHLVGISAVRGDTVDTIEGNTNTDGSREGYGVFRRNRPIHQFRCFVDLSGLK